MATGTVRRQLVGGTYGARASWRQRILSVPLIVKLIGANVTIVIAALSVALYTDRFAPRDARLFVLMSIAFGAALVVNTGLAVMALRPLHSLEQAAERVASGDLEARVPSWPQADANTARIGRTLNRVLDDLITDRARMRRLAAEVIRTGDAQRASISRELNESTAQVLSALALEAGAIAAQHADSPFSARIETIRELTSQALVHVGALAQSVHPRILDDMGLVVALEGLAIRIGNESSAGIDIYANLGAASLSPADETMMYRVAEEAIANAIRHGWAQRVWICLAGDATATQLSIRDDGRGFEVKTAEGQPGIGLFMMQERASLAGATFGIESSISMGTTVSVTLPARLPGAAEMTWRLAGERWKPPTARPCNR